MRPLKVTSVLFALLVVSNASLAREWPFYAGIGFQYAASNSTANTDAAPPSSFPPESISLDGLPFDDDDSGWNAAIGYQFVDFFAVELGYEDLGAFDSSANFAVLGGGEIETPSLSVKGATLKAQFQYPFTERFRATWHLGIMRAEFEAGGALTFPSVPFPPFPVPPIEAVTVPYADPGRETGYFFGFGGSWRFHPHFEVELAYSRKNLEVLEFDTIGLRLLGRIRP